MFDGNAGRSPEFRIKLLAASFVGKRYHNLTRANTHHIDIDGGDARATPVPIVRTYITTPFYYHTIDRRSPTLMTMMMMVMMMLVIAMMMMIVGMMRMIMVMVMPIVMLMVTAMVITMMMMVTTIIMITRHISDIGGNHCTHGKLQAAPVLE